MKSPLWIINSALVTLIFGLLLALLLFHPQKPARSSLQPVILPQSTQSDSFSIDLSQIYRNDPFGTYYEAPKAQQQEEPTGVTVPAAPQLKIPQPTPPVIPQFIPPLAVTLKGVIASTNELNNFAIIANNKTKAEKLYKTGAMIDDAEIIRIANNKVLLIRANGQQETLFVTQTDAEADQIYTQDNSWSDCVRQVNATEFLIDPLLFTQRVTSLAQFIDALDITTAFHKGKSVGCRVGKLAPQSCGSALGLQQGDIIVTMLGTPTTSTKNRVAIYTALKELTLNASINVRILRNNQEIEVHYVLTSLSPKKKQEVPPASPVGMFFPRNDQVEQNAQATLQQAPLYQDMAENLQKNNRDVMQQFGGKIELPAQANITSPTE